jgi:hypothetical protein
LSSTPTSARPTAAAREGSRGRAGTARLLVHS